MKVYAFIGFVYTSNKFESNLILTVDSEMGEKEDAFFDNFHISF